MDGYDVRNSPKSAAEPAAAGPAAAVRGPIAAESTEPAESAEPAEPADAESILTQRVASTRVESVFTKEFFRRVHVRLRVAMRRLHWREHVVVRHLRSD